MDFLLGFTLGSYLIFRRSKSVIEEFLSDLEETCSLLAEEIEKRVSLERSSFYA
jgi:hypothetical protein